MFALLWSPSESWNTHNMGISALSSRIGIWGSVSVISFPTGVRSRASAEKGFWCIWNLKKTHLMVINFVFFATNIYPYFYDWKPMRSIFDILHKKFPGGPIKFQEISRISRGLLNSRRFPGFPGVVDTLSVHHMQYNQLSQQQLSFLFLLCWIKQIVYVCLLPLGIGEHEYESSANHKPRDCCTAPGVLATARQLLLGNDRLQPTYLWQRCRLCGCCDKSRHGNIDTFKRLEFK